MCSISPELQSDVLFQVGNNSLRWKAKAVPRVGLWQFRKVVLDTNDDVGGEPGAGPEKQMIIPLEERCCPPPSTPELELTKHEQLTPILSLPQTAPVAAWWWA